MSETTGSQELELPETATTAQITRAMRDRLYKNQFVVKDSGARQEFPSGMVRDVADDKVDYARVFDGPMLERWAVHLTKGAAKYPDVAPGVANWTLAAGDAERARFRASAVRHFIQWMQGHTDEDHAAAVLFNLNGHEYVKARTAEDVPTPPDMSMFRPTRPT